MYVYKSNEEIIFSHYLNELKLNNYIIDYYYEPEIITIIDKKELIFKTNKKDRVEHLLHDLTYTYDFKIVWNPELSKNLFYKNIGDDFVYVNKKLLFYAKNDISYIDVKGTFVGPHNNSAITFPLVQKILYELKDMFVQKIIPIKLMEKSFVPETYLNTKLNKPRKFKFITKTLNEFLQNANK